jgi:ribosomal protein S27AE
MLYLKACPKCGGDMVSHHGDATERTCLQCGYVRYATPPLPYVRERPRARPEGRREGAHSMRRSA